MSKLIKYWPISWCSNLHGYLPNSYGYDMPHISVLDLNLVSNVFNPYTKTTFKKIMWPTINECVPWSAKSVNTVGNYRHWFSCKLTEENKWRSINNTDFIKLCHDFLWIIIIYNIYNYFVIFFNQQQGSACDLRTTTFKATGMQNIYTYLYR